MPRVITHLTSQAVLDGMETLDEYKESLKELYAYWTRQIVEEWEEWAEASIDWSRRRRSRAKAERRLDSVLLLAAVLGLALVLWYISLSSPGEHFYIGLVGVVLMVPYPTRRMS